MVLLNQYDELKNLSIDSLLEYIHYLIISEKLGSTYNQFIIEYEILNNYNLIDFKTILNKLSNYYNIKIICISFEQNFKFICINNTLYFTELRW